MRDEVVHDFRADVRRHAVAVFSIESIHATPAAVNVALPLPFNLKSINEFVGNL